MPQRGTARRNEVEITGSILVGASGAVTSVVCEEAPNITGSAGTAGSILKDAAAGRYNITFFRKFASIRMTGAMIKHSGTGAFTGAVYIQERPGLVANQSLQLQALATTVDTDVTSGYTIEFSASVREY
jgi:hypothetical protein